MQTMAWLAVLIQPRLIKLLTLTVRLNATVFGKFNTSMTCLAIRLCSLPAYRQFQTLVSLLLTLVQIMPALNGTKMPKAIFNKYHC